MRDLYRWWIVQLVACIPNSIRRLLFRSEKRVGLLIGDERIEAHVEATYRSPELCGLFEHNDTERDRLASAVIGWRKRGFQTGIFVPIEKCLTRERSILRAAEKDLTELLRLDLNRSMPFQPGEFVSDYYAKARGAQLEVKQIVLRRDILEEQIIEAERYGIIPDFVAVWDTTDNKPLPVDLTSSDKQTAVPAKSGSFFVILAAGVAFVLLASASYIALENQASALDQLRPQVNEAREAALKVRKRAALVEARKGTFGALSRRKSSERMLVELWAELAGSLPDTAWITDLRRSKTTLYIAGYAKSASELISILEASKLFKNVGFAAPVTVDPRTNSERFNIRLEVDTGLSEIKRTSARTQPT